MQGDIADRITKHEKLITKPRGEETERYKWHRGSHGLTYSNQGGWWYTPTKQKTDHTVSDFGLSQK